MMLHLVRCKICCEQETVGIKPEPEPTTSRAAAQMRTRCKRRDCDFGIGNAECTEIDALRLGLRADQPRVTI